MTILVRRKRFTRRKKDGNSVGKQAHYRFNRLRLRGAAQVGANMIPVYGSLITILLCTFLPPFFDFWLGNKEEWNRGRVVAAYALMTGIVLVLPVFVGGSLYLDWLFVVLAVAVAVFIAPVSLFGTSFVLLFSNVILPTVILWNLASYNHVDEPMNMILGNTEWPFFLVPIAFGLATWFVASRFLRTPSKV